MRRLFLLLFAAAWLAHAGPAAAHAMLEQASPRVGSTVADSPKELRLHFSEAVEPAFSTIALTAKGGGGGGGGGGDGGAVALGAVALDPNDARTLVVAVPAPLAPGVYRVNWRAVSRDTHTTRGDFTFEVGH